MIKAVYPGTFDPITRGHEDLVRRAAALVGEVVVGIAASQTKRPFFTLQERVDLKPEQRYRLVGIGLSNFCDPEDMLDQRTLFD